MQEEGCAALSNLCYDDENNRRAGAAGGVEAVVEALKAHSADARVQEEGCVALCNICYDDENKRRAVAAGGVEANGASGHCGGAQGP